MIFTVVGADFADWVKLQIEARNQQRVEQKNMMIQMDEEIAAVYRASTKVSRKFLKLNRFI